MNFITLMHEDLMQWEMFLFFSLHPRKIDLFILMYKYINNLVDELWFQTLREHNALVPLKCEFTGLIGLPLPF